MGKFSISEPPYPQSHYSRNEENPEIKYLSDEKKIERFLKSRESLDTFFEKTHEYSLIIQRTKGIILLRQILTYQDKLALWFNAASNLNATLEQITGDRATTFGIKDRRSDIGKLCDRYILMRNLNAPLLKAMKKRQRIKKEIERKGYNDLLIQKIRDPKIPYSDISVLVDNAVNYWRLHLLREAIDDVYSIPRPNI